MSDILQVLEMLDVLEPVSHVTNASHARGKKTLDRRVMAAMLA